MIRRNNQHGPKQLYGSFAYACSPLDALQGEPDLPAEL